MMQNTLPLARKYRPTQFEGPEGLVGQEFVARTVKQALTTGRLAQAYLFTGPRGCGKTTMARILAMALNCESRAVDGEPCTKCDSCQRILAGRGTMDVIEFDAASNRGIDDAKAIRERAAYAASEDNKAKVYIIDECHMFTREAWNALLKLFEEPPPHVYFIAATTEPDRIEKTSRAAMSRFQRFDFRLITPRQLSETMRRISDAEGLQIEDGAIHLIAHMAQGGLRDAIQVLDQVQAYRARQDDTITADLVRTIRGIPSESLTIGALDVLWNRARDDGRARIFDLKEHLDRAGGNYGAFLDDLLAGMIQIQASAVGATIDGPWSEASQKRFLDYAAMASPHALTHIMALIQTYRTDMTTNAAPAALMTYLFESLAIAEDAATQSQGSPRETTAPARRTQ